LTFWKLSAYNNVNRADAVHRLHMLWTNVIVYMNQWSAYRWQFAGPTFLVNITLYDIYFITTGNVTILHLETFLFHFLFILAIK